jgi:hypothetical protein
VEARARLGIRLSENGPAARRTAAAVGAVMALAGLVIVALAIFGGAERFNAPRWTVGACGGAFVFLGGWTAAMYARGYDPNRPEDSLPSPWLQLAILVPGLVLFAAPFHWIAFGPGPREFSGGVSIPFVSARTHANATLGRIAFGLFALLFDAIVAVTVVRLVAKIRRDARG